MSASPKPSGQEPWLPAQIAKDQILASLTADERREYEAQQELFRKLRAGGPFSEPPKDDREKTIHNERTKLSATLINGLALAFLVAGSVTFAANVGTLPSPADQFVRSIVWILAGIGLHWIGRLILGSMR